VREVGGENFGAEKGAKKSLGKARGCVFGSSSKRLEWPHPELVHWWLLFHSSQKNSGPYPFTFSLTSVSILQSSRLYAPALSPLI